MAMPSKKRNVRRHSKKGGRSIPKASVMTQRNAKAREIAVERLCKRAVSLVCEKLGFASSDFTSEYREVRGKISHITFDCPASSSMLDLHILHETDGLGVAIYTTPLEKHTHVGFMIMPLDLLLNMRALQDKIANSADLDFSGELVETVRCA
jgi:hypothetical protein